MTTAVLIEQPRRRQNHGALRAAQIENLSILREAGVILVAGSDEYQHTSTYEVAHLRGLNVFSNAELLRMWSTNCATALFPERRVGRLAPGYEASFLALGGDPLADFAATRDIRLRVKEGVVLDVPPAPPE
jgi:imidazolonepropionase-like amidohydrolase